MSVVVAIRDTDRVWLAADSQVTKGYTKGLITSTNSFKIFKNKSNVIMGGVGSLRDINILSTSDVEFIAESSLLKNKIPFTEIVRRTVPLLFDEFRKFKRVALEDGIEYLESMFIFAYKDTCFMISQEGCVQELDDMFAIGSGGDVAESAYTVLRDVELTCKEKAIKAIMSSCERDLFVNFPIIITDTLTNNFEIFDGHSFYLIKEDGNLELLEELEEEIECTCEDKENCTCEKSKAMDTETFITQASKLIEQLGMSQEEFMSL